MPLTTETLLAYSMGIIGTLLVLLISLVVQPFMDTRYRQAAIINVDELHPVFVQLGQIG